MNHRRILFASLIVFLVFFETGCGKNGKNTVETGITLTPTATSTPTVCPDLPPFYVVLDGTRLQIGEITELDLSENTIGTIECFTGDTYTLPTEERQTNYEPYNGCAYAKEGESWYLYFESHWYRLKTDE